MTLDDLIEKFRRHPLPTVCGIAIVLCFLAFYFRLDVIADLEARHEEVSRQSVQIDGNVVAASNLEEHIGQMRGMLATLDERLVRPAELAVNLKYFYRLEAETGVALADLRQVNSGSKPQAKNAFQGVGYSLILTGSFPQVVAYFDELENGERLYRLSNFNLQKSRDVKQSTLTLALNLELLGVQ